MLLKPDSGFSRSARLAWGLGDRLGRPLFGWWFDLEIEGSLPPGPVVVAVNHFSHLDPIVASMAARRRVRFLAVDELFGRSRVFDRLTLWLGAIPMTRTRIPFGPLKLALAELASGISVGVFPEGVRVWHWGERDPKRGAAWLALRAGVPLVPIAISGSDQAMGRGTGRITRSPMTAEVCEPIDPRVFGATKDPVGAMTDAWRLSIDRALGGG